MSNKDNARRSSVKVFFAGADITDSVEKYLISLTYTDNEEDETDDLQIKLADRSSIWLTKWLNEAIEAVQENPPETASKDGKSEENKTTLYKVVSQSGLVVHSRPGEQYYQYGSLAYGETINVISISGGWANFIYSGKDSYVKSAYLELAESQGSSGSSSGGAWEIGEEVTATGNPQYSSYGVGTPGAYVTNYKGKVTYLNLKDGIPYPICVGSLGWFAENQVQQSKEKAAVPSVDKASKGLKIQAVIVRENWNNDGKDDMLECGQFELDNINASGPPATITIKGTSLPYNSTVRQTLKSKSWENYSMSGIANEIASGNGLTCMFLSNNDPKYSRVEQYRQSDITFLQKLCRDAGCSLKVSNNIIVIFDQAQYEAKNPVRTIKQGEAGGYTKYKVSTTENDRYTSCRVSFTASNGAVITATAYIADYDEKDDNNQCLEIYQKVSNAAEAKALAEKMLRFHNKYEFVASFTFPGDPSLVAGNTVKLEGWGAWDGKYIIKQAKHSVGSSGYTTQITLRRALASSAQTQDSGNNAVATDFQEGDKVMCNDGVSTYYNGVKMASWVPSTVLYVRRVEGDILLVSTEPKAEVYTGRVYASDVHKI